MRASRVGIWSVVVSLLCVGTTAAQAELGGGAGHLGRGTVTLTQSVDPSTGNANTSVTFVGDLSGHGWRYAGTLTGSGQTFGYDGWIGVIPTLSMTSADGSISGRCGASSETAGDVPSVLVDLTFGCVLARNGGIPWEVHLVSEVKQRSVADPWSGHYVQAEPAVSQVGLAAGQTYGEVQLGNQSYPGVFEYGPLRLSGQIQIGAQLFRGDLVSDISGPITEGGVPPLTVTGSSDGLKVTGTCGGDVSYPLDEVASAYDFTCSLSIGSDAPVAVRLVAVFTNSTGGCSFRDCWGDQAGYFTTKS